ncbi:MAG: RING finger domain-containing protein [Candidatus Lokiarchaeota archaeon]
MIDQKQVRFCTKCGVEFSVFVNYVPNFCPKCGHKVNSKKLQKYETKCLICHQPILNRQNSIECSYCSGKFHSSCVSPWLNHFNACPLCQNIYTYPKNRKI